MKRANKEELQGVMAGIFQGAQMGILVDYRGLKVGEVTELRRRLHEAHANMRVLKNRIARRALAGSPFEPLAPSLTDTRALVYSADPVGPAKAVVRFGTENERLKLVCGFLRAGAQGTLMTADQVKALSRLPSRQELLATLLAVMHAPAQKLVRTLHEVPAKFVRTLAAVKEAKEQAAA
ncbi:MAG: 50S ribosomal protein L10 [Candidatus Lambdaproteobacteria bacterium]|nr:50S ribosomal protein L10 [Candidatus Lambdaproteobacteria bacterium]